MNTTNFGMDLVLDNTTWYNSKTGDSFKVRSNYFENNQMILLSTDGRTFNFENMNDYVQWQGSGTPPATPLTTTPRIDIPAEVIDILDGTPQGDIDPDDLALINGNRTIQQIPRTSKTENFDIIDRALAKTQLPDWNIVMKWSKFPQREIEMLAEIMNIPIDEISNYYMDKITSEFNTFMDNIKDQIKSYIQKNSTVVNTPMINEKTTKKHVKTTKK